MSIYYVASLARYVIVEADSEAQAREVGLPALRDLYAADGTDARFVQIRTVRLATDNEFEFEREHQQMLADYLGCKQSGD